MASFWDVVDRVLWQSDIVLLVLDSRLVNETRNRELEEKIRSLGKPLIYVLTKCDLAEKKVLMSCKRNLRPSVFISAREHLGIGKLRERILIEAGKAGLTKKTVRVGVLGYPNVGKSSLVNVMKGRSSAPTSIISGYTKGVQKIRADKRILFLDTPGVIPYHEGDKVKHGIIGAEDFSKARDPDLVVAGLMKRFPGRIEGYFKVTKRKVKEETIKEIAIKKNLLTKGGKPDIDRASRMILKAWQTGKIK